MTPERSAASLAPLGFSAIVQWWRIPNCAASKRSHLSRELK